MDESKLSELGATSSNLARARKREASKSPLPKDREAEIAAVDELIGRALKACKAGQTKNRKTNPSFSNLQLLVKTRAFLMRGFSPTKKATADVLRELDAILAVKN